MSRHLSPYTLLLSASLLSSASAQVTTYDDVTTFLAATGAVAQPAWPNVGHLSGAGSTYQLGLATISAAAPSTGIWVGSGNDPIVGPDWTTLVAGNDIAIDGQEHLVVQFSTTVVAFGFDFAEPTTPTVLYAPCNNTCPCSNSTFRVTLRLGGAQVDTFDFNRPDDVAAFVGIWSTSAFDGLTIDELGGSCDDEYFGQFYIRTEPASVGSAYCHPAIANSTGAPAVLSARGSTLVAQNDLLLQVQALPAGSFGFFLASRTQGLVAQPGNSVGVLCLGGAIGRYVGTRADPEQRHGRVVPARPRPHAHSDTGRARRSRSG
jgi:hypothetical protein